MRKLVILAVGVVIAAMANAASVKWQATSIKDINGNAIGSKAESAGWTAVCTIFASDGTTVIGSNTDKTAAMSKFDGAVDGTAVDTIYFAQLVITDDKGNTITSEKAQFTTDSAAEYGPIQSSRQPPQKSIIPAAGLQLQSRRAGFFCSLALLDLPSSANARKKA